VECGIIKLYDPKNKKPNSPCAMVSIYQASVSGSGSGSAVFDQLADSSQVSVASHCRFNLCSIGEKVKWFFQEIKQDS